MALEFAGFDIDGIGERAADPGLMFCTLWLHLRETLSDHTQTVRVHLPVARHPDATLRDIAEEARDRAASILRAACSQIEAHTAEQLEAKAQALPLFR